MSNQELAEAHDELCPACSQATLTSSDGGALPCHQHKLKFMQRTYPVLRMDGMMEGEWTHAWVDTEGMNTWLEEILQEWDDSSLTMTEFLRNLNLRVVQLTKEEYEKVPEL